MSFVHVFLMESIAMDSKKLLLVKGERERGGINLYRGLSG